jgi:hypothetical protein
VASLNRYQNDSTIQGGKLLATNASIPRIREAVRAGLIRTETRTLKGFQRLDVLADQYYGDGRLWWVIAAASDIGWWLQAPPGTRIVVPLSISEVEAAL